MAINDILSSVLETIGLKKSEEDRARQEIEHQEEELRCANDALSALDEELQAAEQRLRTVKAQYDAATGSMKKSREALLLSLMKDFRHIQERQQITLARRDSVQALLQQRRLELEQLLHPVETDALEEAADAKKELLEDLHERDEALGQLEENTYQPEVQTVDTSSQTAADKEAEKAAAAKLEKEYAELMGDEPAKTPEKPSTTETNPQEIA